MKKLRKTVENILGIPFDRLGLPAKLGRIDTGDPDAMLYGSPEAVADPILIQRDIRDFASHAPIDFCQVGFWGYGTNSYAFYLSRVTPWSSVFFRLPYGGIFGDDQRDAKQVREFLLAFFEFETVVKRSARKLEAVESMGVGRYRILLGPCPLIAHDKSMLRSPAFNQVFGVTAPAQPDEQPVLPPLASARVYNGYFLPDGEVGRRQAGRYMVVDEYLYVLEDYYGLLGESLPNGPMDPARYRTLASLGQGRKVQVVPEGSDPWVQRKCTAGRGHEVDARCVDHSKEI